PLAGILVSVKLVRRRLEKLIGDDEARAKTDDTLAMIERETARSGDIVRNLLMFSRQRELSMATEDLGEVQRRALRLVQHQADLQDVQVMLNVEDDLPEIECDGNQIQQACLAVMMNAIDAMPDGGELRVDVHRVDDEHLGVDIADTGIGIPEDVQLRIFEPFFTTKEEGKGTGLGLSVMYGIVQRHAGRVHVDSEVGRGTTIRIVLPLHPEVRETDPAGTELESR
ncbi:MAG TPA: ATP-binding protein, partial [Candidatus Krumholzibacteria bacterium]|nr:ATP-binding protein [Candidatus Krumholzibacteria bacterium]